MRTPLPYRACARLARPGDPDQLRLDFGDPGPVAPPAARPAIDGEADPHSAASGPTACHEGAPGIADDDRQLSLF